MKSDILDCRYKRIFVQTTKAVWAIAWLVDETYDRIKIAFCNVKRNHSEHTPCVFAFPPKSEIDYAVLEKANITELRCRE